MKATITVGNKSVDLWGLQYTVVAADVAADGFHQEAGQVQIQGYLEYSANQKWSSSIITRDYLDRPLEILARLA